MSSSVAPVVCVRQLHHQYVGKKGSPANEALRGIDLDIPAGEIVALLGPNGSGKTTLFRLICTLLPVQSGTVAVAGFDAKQNPLAVRANIGIVFQSPSLDKKLTVDENIACQAALYGITGKELNDRRDEVLGLLDLGDRRSALCETLSGGLKRRVELAKGMLHRPPLMLLDEPSTGLDPSARLSLWDAIKAMAQQGTTVLLTTHLLEEADKADRVAILCEGRKIAEGSPHQLRSEMGESVVTISSPDIAGTLRVLNEEFGLNAKLVNHQIRFQSENPSPLLPELMDRLGDAMESITVGRPSLEDVFVAKTGLRFDESQSAKVLVGTSS
ncbi:ATP-binding cassette domain-containing protein [Rubripirellula amarantea]|nr:ATP-binding cassette domain-containing protein [Rubripirellula amarantea]